MEIEDSSSPPTAAVVEDTVAVHPLALVHMSDHYTRVTAGGSTLAPQAPVVGLLFGTPAGAMLDAEDVPLDDPVRAVELHQAVFPQNVVIGSYRVTAQDVEPTADDVRQTVALQNTFGTDADHNGPMYFALLRIPVKQNKGTSPKEAAAGRSHAETKELPLQLFTLRNNSVLVATEDWQLTTAVAERIAVERVLRDRPEPESEQIHDAWMALDARLAQCMEYLQRSSSGSMDTTEHYELWRQIYGLIAQAHLLRTPKTGAGHNQSSLLPQQVAVLAKTVDTLSWYTDKFRVVNEARGGKASSVPLMDR